MGLQKVRHNWATFISMGFPGGAGGKEPTCQCRRRKRHRFDPWVRKIPWRRAWHLTTVFLPGESHGQGSLAACSPRGCKKLDTTERLSTHTAVQVPMWVYTCARLPIKTRLNMQWEEYVKCRFLSGSLKADLQFEQFTWQVGSPGPQGGNNDVSLPHPAQVRIEGVSQFA